MLRPCLARRFSTAAATTPSKGSALVNTKYEVYKFQKEDVKTTMEELPELQYYHIGNDVDQNKYANVTMDRPILQPPSADQMRSLEKAQIRISQLENGCKVATVDKGGLVSHVGLYVNAGSRFEQPDEFGLSHMIKQMAFKSTAHLSQLRTVKTFEHLGAKAECTLDREHISWTTEVLREQLPYVVPLLVGNVLFPRLLPWEVNQCSETVKVDEMKLSEDIDKHVTEMVFETAFHNNTLGNRRLISKRCSESFFGEEGPDRIRAYMLKHFAPERSVVAGVNVDHEELCKWAMRSFVDYNPIPYRERPEPRPEYTGGMRLIDDVPKFGLTSVAIAFETAGWNSEDVVPLTVLQMLLGGGGAFSTGGPGKGMHSRLYREVLGRYGMVESCQAFNVPYSDAGLFGLHLCSTGDQVPALVKIAAEQLSKLTKFSPEELQRAKNQLKGMVYLNCENSKVLLDDIARQLILSGKVVDCSGWAARIDRVTEKELVSVAQKMLKTQPTFVVYGDTSYAPNYEQFKAMIGLKK